MGGGFAASVFLLTPRPARPAAPALVTLEAGRFDLRLAAPPAPTTPGIAYNSSFPGPLLRAKLGESLDLRLVNRLATPTTLSLPGLRVPDTVAGIGGLTTAPLAPGASLELRLTPPDAGFNLYMPHAGAGSAEQIARGLMGPIIIDETAPPVVDLEAIVVLSDWRLDVAGAATELVTANSAAAPARFEARPGARVRLRLANGATARTMTLVITALSTQVIAVDGQPSEVFAPLKSQIPLGPGARIELMFDLPREAGATGGLHLRGEGGEADRPLLIFTTAGEPIPAKPAISRLPPNPHLPAEIALERAQRIELTLTGGGDAPFAINGAVFADWGPKPVFSAPRGAPVMLALVNKTAVPQAMRLGGHVARQLHALDAGWEPYWRDIRVVPPGRTVHAAFVADNPGKWPFESASPERRNAGLASWFQVG